MRTILLQKRVKETNVRFQKKLGNGNRLVRIFVRQPGEVLVQLMEEGGDPQRRISLSLSRWKKMRLYWDEIHAAVSKLVEREHSFEPLHHHLGGNVFVSVTPGVACVDVREYYLPRGENEPRPSKSGLGLRLSEWDSLAAITPLIEEKIPELQEMVSCDMQDDHQNQEGMLRCPECNPNDYASW